MTLIKPDKKLVVPPANDEEEPLVPKGTKETEEYLKLFQNQ